MSQISMDFINGRVAGVDEAGRGPLAGPVVAAAVILDPERPIAGLADSKILGEDQREVLAGQIREASLAWAVARAEAAEIDELNILQASLLAMRRAVAGLYPPPDSVLVDGRHLPELPMPGEAVVRGDARVASIGAASILAKVARDGWMKELGRAYPDYGFGRHKGYPTPQHLAALRERGVTSEHRRSFAPVRRALQEETER